MLAIILVSFLVALAMLLFLMKWVTDNMWQAKDSAVPEFREVQKDFDATSINYLSSGRKHSGNQEDENGLNQLGIYKDPDRKDDQSEASFIHEVEQVNMQKLEELDPFIIEKILKNYQDYKDYLQKELLGSCDRQSKKIEELTSEIDRLKYLLNERYERMIGLLRLDVDYNRLKNVKIKMEEEKDEPNKREKRVKPSDIRLSKSEEKRANDVLKQISNKKNEANILSEIYENNPAEEDLDEENEPKAKANASPSKQNETLEDRVKAQFEKKLAIMGDLSDFDKEKLRDEFNSEMINMEYLLAGEREQQELQIRKMLELRRKKPTNSAKHVEIDFNNLSPEEEEIKEKVDFQVEDESRDMQREIEQKVLQKIKRSEERLLKHLGAPANLSEKEKDTILDRHKSELEQIVQEITHEKEKQLDDLQRRIEKRKLARASEKIREYREENQPSALIEDAEPVAEIPAEIEESEKVIKLSEEEKAKEREMEEQHQKEKERLNEKHAEEIAIKTEELGEDLELEVENEMEQRKNKIEEKYKYKQSKIEEARRKLKDQLLFAGTDKEASGNLMQEVKQKDDQLRNILEEQKMEQDLLLEEKINRRRIAKQKKLLAFKNRQHDERIESNLKHQKQKHDLQGEYEIEKIKEIINQMKRQNPGFASDPTELYNAFEQLWNNKEALELANMFGRQLTEKESKLRILYNKNVEQKLMEKQAVKEKYKMLYDDLEGRKDELGPEECAERQRDYRVEEENDLKEMDIKETMNHKKEEFALRQELEEKFAREMGELQDKMSSEKLNTMKNIFGGLRDEEVELSNRMEDMRKAIEREKDKKIKDLELDKKIMLEKYENEMKQRYNSYEEIIKKQREVEKLLKEKKGNITKMIEERKKQMEELKDKAQFTPEQEKQLIERYNQELKNLESAMEQERNRQFAAMQESLRPRRLNVSEKRATTRRRQPS
eukprot:TRINITY_DN2425_c0_g2_i6.p1 TRINITY_DN2425_c0_g2~~TRINITY_DN2425_c0_g2_i6.p1  ORF type:complete len:949 (+),score=279.25 TRINITY_DN2425_c0_g2_i6:462-3308(+)